MNEFRAIGPSEPRHPRTTQVADGVPRYRWRLDQFEALGELGVLGEDDHVELIEGELIPMSPKGNRHERVRAAVLKWLIGWLRAHPGANFELFVEPGWRAGEDTYLEPDFVLAPMGASPTEVAPHDALLLIEVAHSSLAYDTGAKADLYARFGVPDYWVIDAATLELHVHREPSASGYSNVSKAARVEAITAVRLPALTFCAAELALA